MIITRTSPFTSKTTSMNIDVTDEQLQEWRSGTLIQDAMPNLSDDDREFIKTGITAQEWEDMFPPRDEDLDRDEYWNKVDETG
tara:strand:- start:667 stop:915 length:249 start_codon:yes stop_codon:yes gene_type:complete